PPPGGPARPEDRRWWRPCRRCPGRGDSRRRGGWSARFVHIGCKTWCNPRWVIGVRPLSFGSASRGGFHRRGWGDLIWIKQRGAAAASGQLGEGEGIADAGQVALLGGEGVAGQRVALEPASGEAQDQRLVTHLQLVGGLPFHRCHELEQHRKAQQQAQPLEARPLAIALGLELTLGEFLPVAANQEAKLHLLGGGKA